MTLAKRSVLPWTAAVAGALALNGAMLWAIQKAPAWPVADVVAVRGIQVVMSQVASPQKMAEPIPAAAEPVARRVPGSLGSRARAKPVVTQPTVNPTVKPTVKNVLAAWQQSQPSPARSTSLPDSLARMAESVAEAAVAAGKPAVAVAREPSVAAHAAGGAGDVGVSGGGTVGSDDDGAAKDGAAQDAVEFPSESAAYLNNPPPDYPPLSRLRRESGTTVVRVLIGVDGHAHAARLEKSSGYVRLDDVALATALDRWRYRPGTRNGMPEAMWYDVSIEFVLR